MPRTTPKAAFKLNTDSGISAKVERILSGMTLEQKLGQMITVEYCGGRITPDIINVIREHHCGGPWTQIRAASNACSKSRFIRTSS